MLFTILQIPTVLNEEKCNAAEDVIFAVCCREFHELFYETVG